MVKTITDAGGRFKLEKVIPGPQKLVASRSGFLPSPPVEVTFAAGLTTPITSISLLPRPPQQGVFVVRDRLRAVPTVDIDVTSMNMSGMPVILASVLPSSIRITGEINMVAASDSPESDTCRVTVYSLAFAQQETDWVGLVPDRWFVNQEVTAQLQLTKVMQGLYTVRGSLARGRYTARLETQRGVRWHFFEVASEINTASKPASGEFPVLEALTQPGSLVLKECHEPDGFPGRPFPNLDNESISTDPTVIRAVAADVGVNAPVSAVYVARYFGSRPSEDAFVAGLAFRSVADAKAVEATITQRSRSRFWIWASGNSLIFVGSDAGAKTCEVALATEIQARLKTLANR